MPTPIGKDRPQPWNKGLFVGQKRPPESKHVWSIRVRLEIARSKRDGHRTKEQNHDYKTFLLATSMMMLVAMSGQAYAGITISDKR